LFFDCVVSIDSRLLTIYLIWIDKIVNGLKEIYGNAFTHGEYVTIHRIKTMDLEVMNSLPDMDTEIQFFFRIGLTTMIAGMYHLNFQKFYCMIRALSLRERSQHFYRTICEVSIK